MRPYPILPKKDILSDFSGHSTSQFPTSICFPLPPSYRWYCLCPLVHQYTGLTDSPLLAMAKEGAGFAVPKPQGARGWTVLLAKASNCACYRCKSSMWGWFPLPPGSQGTGLARPVPLPVCPGDSQPQAPWVFRAPPWEDLCLSSVPRYASFFSYSFPSSSPCQVQLLSLCSRPPGSSCCACKSLAFYPIKPTVGKDLGKARTRDRLFGLQFTDPD